MKKNSIVIVGVLLLLCLLSVFIFKFKNKSTTVDGDARNFKFKDTAAITRIFIADKEGDQSLLTRTKNGWLVNNKYPCRSDAILNLLEAVKNMEVKMAVPKKAKESVLKFMASSALKVEIYKGDDLVKQYYLGHEPPDSEGSYMLLTDVESGKNFEDPYIVFIPGFKGYLQPRFIAKENEWRDRLAINFTPPQLKQIKVQHNQTPDSSFTIELVNTTTFKLKDSKNNDIAFDMNKMRQYLVYYQNLQYEALITGKNKKLEDSLSKNVPFNVVTITTNDLRTEEYKFYYKKPTSLVPEHGVVYNTDPDRLYLRFANDKEWALIQYFVFGKLLVSPAYFAPAGVKK